MLYSLKQNKTKKREFKTSRFSGKPTEDSSKTSWHYQSWQKEYLCGQVLGVGWRGEGQEAER